MGRIFKVQARNLDQFRRKRRRKLRKGDIIRVYGIIPESKVKQLLDIQPTNNVLNDKRFGNSLIKTQDKLSRITVVEIGLRSRSLGSTDSGDEPLLGDFSSGFSVGFTTVSI